MHERRVTMYAVKCYNADGIQFGETDYFDTLDEACDFAEDFAEGDLFADVITPNGTVICIG